jgi:hypothetical protein
MQNNINAWKNALHSHDEGFLARVLADDVVFHSPAVHSPQKGKALAYAYLSAAKVVLNNETFRYVNEWQNANSAILEFELELNGVHVNGIDIITWNNEGQIIDFKVMVRPMKGINAVVAGMSEQLMKAK